MKTALLLLIGAAAFAQSNAGQAPAGRGVYYRMQSGWVALPMHLVDPHFDQSVREFLNLGRPTATATIPGAHAAIRIDQRHPKLELRDFPESTGIALVRQTAKSDYRQLRMSTGRDDEEYAHLRKQDVLAADLTQADGVITLIPRGDLAPGEYAIVTALEPGYRGLRVEFDFAVQ